MFFLIIVSAMPTLADGGGTVTNSATIVGEAGNDGIGGDGGTGIEFNGSGITFINTGAVTGGSGGSTSGLGGPGVSFTGAGASFLNSGVVSGGAGGFPSFGGNGGGGGPGVSFTGPGASFLNSGAVSGGAGGDLPSLGANGGGPGASFSGSGATFINSGTVTGGVGYGGLVNIPHGSDGGVGGAGVASSAKGATLTNSGTVSGGAGGLGITGGGGGAGMSFTESGATLSNSGMVSGGAGGSGGFGLGGGGGTGASFTGSGATFTNSGTVNGGGGGSGFRSGGATGGAGIVGTGLTVINSGAVSGGLSASGLRANAITFTGGTNILELQAGSTITGNVVAFSAADTLRLGGTSDASIDVTQIGAQYQGFGLFQKTGSSTWMLTGANATAMPWTLSGGTLQVNANMASSAMTVSAGGILGGIGTVGSVNVNGGGTLAPGQGAGLGTMTIAGNLTFQPGAVYVVQVHPSAMSMADVAAGGTATLAGTIEATFPAGSVPRSDTILHAAGFGGTRFDGLQISDLPTGFGASLDYTTTDVILALTATLGTGQLSGNQQQVSAALNDFFNAGGVLTPNFVSLFGLTGRDLNTALTQLSGEAATGAQQGAFQLMTEFLTLMLDPFVDGRTGIVVGFAPDSVTSFQLSSEDPASIAKSAPVAQGWTLWGSAYGGANHTNGDHAVVGSNDLTASTGGFAAGADYRLSPSTALGFALAGGVLVGTSPTGSAAGTAPRSRRASMARRPSDQLTSRCRSPIRNTGCRRIGCPLGSSSSRRPSMLKALVDASKAVIGSPHRSLPSHRMSRCSRRPLSHLPTARAMRAAAASASPTRDARRPTLGANSAAASTTLLRSIPPRFWCSGPNLPGRTTGSAIPRSTLSSRPCQAQASSFVAQRRRATSASSLRVLSCALPMDWHSRPGLTANSPAARIRSRAPRSSVTRGEGQLAAMNGSAVLSIAAPSLPSRGRRISYGARTNR